MSDYLYDKSGEPDPEVVELERKLAPLRYRPRPLEVTSLKPRRRPVLFVMGALAAAAVLLLFVSVDRFAMKKEAAPEVAGLGPAQTPAEPAPSFAVIRLAGAPAIGETRLDADGRLPVGGWLETDDASRAQIQVATIGAVRVEPGSRVRLLGTGPTEHRLELARGRINAWVDAPPRLFVVDTPSATAVDLGCVYDLTVAEDGGGRLQVTSGMVLLEGQGRTSTVRRGTIAETRRGFGPGTPYAEDAPEPLRRALARLDFEGGGLADAKLVARLARPADLITLEHLDARLSGPARAAVRQRLCRLTPCQAP